MVAAFGDPGHAFPAIALAGALRERGHEVTVESWERWRATAAAAGLSFRAAEEHRVFPPGPDGRPYRQAVGAARALEPLFAELDPDVVVADILTLAPALAAEAAGVPRATLIPHVHPHTPAGMPFFALGAVPPRTPSGSAMWRLLAPLLHTGLRRGRRELNGTRRRLGLPALARFHGGISPDLALVGTFPQLEYPRRWPPGTLVTGPMSFELPHPEVAVPEGEDPLVLIAPSTSQDPECRLLHAALSGLADQRVRVIATTNRHRPPQPPRVPANARLVDWLSYSRVMPRASLVICHGGHGTVARALSHGVPVLACPAAGDMAETGARLTWSGLGLSVPRRLCTAATVRWAALRILADPGFGSRAAEVAAWAERNDGAARGAQAVEALARRAVEER